MGSSTFMVLLAVTTILAGFEAEAAVPGPSNAKIYIVFPNKDLKPLVLLQSVFQSLSESPAASRKHATEALITEYKYISGFAAWLTPSEARKLSGTPGVYLFPSRRHDLDRV